MKMNPRVINTKGGRYLLRFSSFKPAIAINRKDVNAAEEICAMYACGTPNRTKLIKAELRKRGIIR